MISYDRYEFSSAEKTVIWIATGAAGVLISLAFYRSILFAVIVIPFGEKIREYIGRLFIERRRRDLLEQFKDFLFVISTSIGAGRSMKAAMEESVPELREIYGTDAVLVKELEMMELRMKGGNEDDVIVLMEFAMRTGQEDIIDFVTVYSICKVTGSNLIIALNKAASVIIDKMTIEKEIRELVRRKEQEGMLIFIMPLAVIVFLNLCSPDYIDPMYSTWTGRIIMTLIVVSNVGIYEIISKVTKVDI